MQEEESMAYWYKIHTPLILDNLWPKMIHTSIRRGQTFLLNHISSKIPLIIIYAEFVGSTNMSMTLPVDNLVTLIRAFAHQISLVVDSHDGYVLKYVGDAVISFFPGRVNNKNKYHASNNSVECGKLMINVASKITSLTGANKVSIGENVYKSLDRKVQREFHELSISDGRWKYINYGTDKRYKVYTLNS